MEKAILIENMTRDELKAMFNQPSSQTDADMSAIASRATIDRNFIKRNLSCSQRLIFKYERLGVLRQVENLENAKTVFYRLADYLEMCRQESERCKPKNRVLR